MIEVAATAWLTLALLEDNGKLYLTDPKKERKKLVSVSKRALSLQCGQSGSAGHGLVC